MEIISILIILFIIICIIVIFLKYDPKLDYIKPEGDYTIAFILWYTKYYSRNKVSRDFIILFKL